MIDIKIALVENEESYIPIIRGEFSRFNLQLTPFSVVETFCQTVAQFKPDVVICDGFTLEPANIRMYPLLSELKLDARIILASHGLLGTSPQADTRRRLAIEQGVLHFWDKQNNRYQRSDVGGIETVTLPTLVLRLVNESRSEQTALINQRLGSQLKRLITEITNAAPAEHLRLVEKYRGRVVDEKVSLPISISLDCASLADGEDWAAYKARVTEELEQMSLVLGEGLIEKPRLSIAGYSLACHAMVEKIEELARHPKVKLIGLRRRLKAAAVNDAAKTIGLVPGGIFHRKYKGKGVRVAVLDSGIDLQHKHLTVAESRAVNGYDIRDAGEHATRVAGIIASRCDACRGLAPGVELLNIKAMAADSTCEADDLADGIAAAIDLKAQVLVVSAGFNYLDESAEEGHGHGLTIDGDDCQQLRTAARLAVRMGVTCVMAAGNNQDKTKDANATTLLTPGIVDEVITVGAVDNEVPPKRADYSSYGKSLNGADKPEIVAPGVGIRSTGLDVRNNKLTKESESEPCRQDSGTSFATPMVAAAVAMLIQKRQEEGKSWTPADIKEELLRDCVRPLHGEPGTGRGILIFP